MRDPVPHVHACRFPTGAPRLLVPQQGNLYIHDAPMDATSAEQELRIVFDKSSTGCKGPAIDPKVPACMRQLQAPPCGTGCCCRAVGLLVLLLTSAVTRVLRSRPTATS